MKNIFAFALLTLLLAGCASKNHSGEIARENFEKSLQDSISAITLEIDSCNNQVAILSDKVNNMLADFTAVQNSREVEGYTILNGWSSRYPLQQTGVVARISASEQLELIAALSGGVFDQIRVSAPDASAVTAVVPHDQALNYRRDGLTTVMFSGVKADSVAMLIMNNELNPLTVTYFNGGKATGSWKIGNEYASMISATCRLYEARSSQTRMERRAMMLNEKLKLLRRHLPDKDDKSEK